MQRNQVFFVHFGFLKFYVALWIIVFKSEWWRKPNMKKMKIKRYLFQLLEDPFMWARTLVFGLTTSSLKDFLHFLFISVFGSYLRFTSISAFNIFRLVFSKFAVLQFCTVTWTWFIHFRFKVFIFLKKIVYAWIFILKKKQ